MTLSDWSIIKAHGHLGPTAIQRLHLPHVTISRVRLVWKKLGCSYAKPAAKPRAPWGTYPSDRRERETHERNALYCRRWRAARRAAAIEAQTSIAA